MSNTEQQAEGTNKCKHELCTCSTSDSDGYCSAYCESAAKGVTTVRCECGHSGCAD
ncbi:MAG TPA: hypothetical protein VGO50_04850 [Pyrinomonadaceae bacterium]|jgi:hypothetical protein|nr:hypothetical protein [Pyrinomonadaceae bacterium]